MNRNPLAIVLAALPVALGVSSVLAQTPDGAKSAEENVCDALSGAAYGLCFAYCEAMDCQGEELSVSEVACLKVRDKFIQLQAEDLPCEVLEGIPGSLAEGSSFRTQPICIDDPGDKCCPELGHQGCPGIRVCPSGDSCGGIVGQLCPDGLTCVYPRGSCGDIPDNQGLCVFPDCPAPGSGFPRTCRPRPGKWW